VRKNHILGNVKWELHYSIYIWISGVYSSNAAAAQIV